MFSLFIVVKFSQIFLQIKHNDAKNNKFTVSCYKCPDDAIQNLSVPSRRIIVSWATEPKIIRLYDQDL